MTTWVRGSRLNRDQFASLFFGRRADSPAVVKLSGAVAATIRNDVVAAASDIAAAIEAVGIYQWPRFLAEAQVRASSLGALAATEVKDQVPDLKKDAIRPVYPLETALTIGAAGTAGGAAAAARSVAGAIFRQFTPDHTVPKETELSPAPASNKSGGQGAPFSDNGGLTRPQQGAITKINNIKKWRKRS